MIDAIIQYESGDMTEQEVIEFFAELVCFGYIHHLQGHYQRTAQALIEDGLISADGEVL